MPRVGDLAGLMADAVPSVEAQTKAIEITRQGYPAAWASGPFGNCDGEALMVAAIVSAYCHVYMWLRGMSPSLATVLLERMGGLPKRTEQVFSTANGGSKK